MEFNIVGQGDPFLHVTLNRGEKLICESDAMVMMESNLELKGEMKGGFLQSLGRKIANGESFFQQSNYIQSQKYYSPLIELSVSQKQKLDILFELRIIQQSIKNAVITENNLSSLSYIPLFKSENSL